MLDVVRSGPPSTVSCGEETTTGGWPFVGARVAVLTMLVPGAVAALTRASKTSSVCAPAATVTFDAVITPPLKLSAGLIAASNAMPEGSGSLTLTVTGPGPALATRIVKRTRSPGSSGVPGLWSAASLAEPVRSGSASTSSTVGSAGPAVAGLSVWLNRPAALTPPCTEIRCPSMGLMPSAVRASTSRSAAWNVTVSCPFAPSGTPTSRTSPPTPGVDWLVPGPLTLSRFSSAGSSTAISSSVCAEPEVLWTVRVQVVVSPGFAGLGLTVSCGAANDGSTMSTTVWLVW